MTTYYIHSVSGVGGYVDVVEANSPIEAFNCSYAQNPELYDAGELLVIASDVGTVTSEIEVVKLVLPTVPLVPVSLKESN